MPTPDELGRMYATGTYHDVHYGDTSTERHGPSIRFLVTHLSPAHRRTLLDFGCGNGSFMRAAHAEGISVAGVEHSEATAASLGARTGLDIASLDSRLRSPARYDIIHMGDVLEHLTDPAEVFDKLEKVLAPGGAFFIEGPLQANASVVYYMAAGFGHLRQRAGRFRPGSSAPTHLLLATAASQRDFFATRLGYVVRTFHVYEDGWPYLHRGDATPGAAWLAKRAIGRLAVAAAAAPGLKGRIGNRFMTLVGPTSRSERSAS